ncbi:glycosidase, partial [Vibrio antiquarius]
GSYVDLKQSGTDKVLFALNTLESARSVTLTQESVGTGELVDLLTNEKITPSNGQYQILMSPLQGRFFAVKP